ncbi:MAG: M20/M25/M40 family metallo-hydrolase [Candidatus Koribacter versatilis]|uniref:M20/M25/M40 family metallo-hydrolase n=1 Tax=Candidatus Korobacter versatilis TaxID=658062 RepID=A0A932EQ28_9BACT|nr:M20/M25/M40 family metallo-hydrolase [Candidatus Koribacter versatilis]
MKRRLVTVLMLLSALATAQQPDFAAAKAEATKLLQELVRIDTSNPPGNEIKAAEYIKGVLAKEGIASEIVESAPGRASLIARLKGNGSKQPLLLLGHLDVVGVERARWTVDPFAAEIHSDGYMYGRGSSDDKAMDAANLEVFLLLHRMKVPLDRDVILLAEAGEEGTTQFGIDYVVANHWEKIACEYALNEGGDFALQPNGKLAYAGVAPTQKLPRGLKVTARGSSGHGSMPRLDNPITHLSAAIAKIGAWQAPVRLNETTRAFFEQLAKISPPEKAWYYTHLDDPKTEAYLRAHEIGLNSMLRTSIVPTIIRGGFRENVIPAEAEATLDVRALPDEDIDALIATLKQLVNDPAVEITRLEGGQKRPRATPSRLDTEMFQALARAQKKVWPEAVTVPVLQVGATDSAQLRAKGVQAYDIGVPETDEDDKRVHGNDERVNVEQLGKFTEYLWAVTVDIAGHK